MASEWAEERCAEWFRKVGSIDMPGLLDEVRRETAKRCAEICEPDNSISLAELNRLTITSPAAAAALVVTDLHGTHLAHKIRHEFALEDE